MVKHGRIPAGTIEEAMDSLMNANKPIYILESQHAPKASIGHINDPLRTKIRSMVGEVKLLARENLQLKNTLKSKDNIIEVTARQKFELKAKLYRNVKELTAKEQENQTIRRDYKVVHQELKSSEMQIQKLLLDAAVSESTINRLT